jgi:2-polyprenyl-6-methoxyphenol hydroxylase and related FAD-dependent oxidoreductases
MDAVEAAAAGSYRRVCVWAADPARALCFDGGDAGIADLGNIQRHDVLLHALWQRLPEGVAQPGSQVVAAQPDGAGRLLHLADGSSLRARLVVAADGAASPLRRLARLRTVDWPYPQRALVANVRTAHGHEHTAWQRFPADRAAGLPAAGRRSQFDRLVGGRTARRGAVDAG